MATLDDALAIFCPNANSYRRFQANSYAPLAKSWGVNNRTVSFRVPGGPAQSRHVEHRICSADANPYLAAAALLAGIHKGIREQIDPGEAITGNGYEQARETLATDWLTALRTLERSAWAKEALGEDFLDIFLAIKWEEFRQFVSEVGEQDWRWYLNQENRIRTEKAPEGLAGTEMNVALKTTPSAERCASYYTATLNSETDYPTLQGTVEADVVIIGGGVMIEGGGAMLGAVAPFLNSVLIAPKRQRQHLVGIGEALKALDRDESVDAIEQRAQVGGDAEIGL
eukprot:gene48897-59872_t